MDTTVCDKVCQWTAACRWISPGIPVSSTNKIDSHDIADILVKVALNIIILTITLMIGHVRSHYNIKQVAIRWRYSRQALNADCVRKSNSLYLICDNHISNRSPSATEQIHQCHISIFLNRLNIHNV